jgi:phosphotriesterase-related protein
VSVVRTVNGEIPPSTIGVTSMHEHVLVDATVWYRVREPADERFRDEPLTPESMPDVRWSAYSFLDNLLLEDATLATNELSAFAEAGGSTVVDMTSGGLSPDPVTLQRISERAGVNIVLGCGFYVHASHRPEICRASVDELEEMIEGEVTGGVGGTGVRPGVIGEIGMGGPPTDCEQRVLRAAARVAARHGMSLHIHTDGGGAHGPEHIEDCAGEGPAPDRIVCGHMDERLDSEYHRAVLATGASIAFDTFGSELNFSGLFHHPSDRERMSALARLIDDGFADRIVVGHDVFVKAHLHALGGYGYDHLPRRVVPALTHEYGIADETIRTILVDNPRRLLACSVGGDAIESPAAPGRLLSNERS